MYKSTPPEEINDKLQSYANQKVPYFFIYAKNKTKRQVAKKNSSTVNRIQGIVPRQRLNFQAKVSGKFDYRMLMHNPKLICTRGVEEIIAEYRKAVKSVRINPKAMLSGEDSYSYQFRMLREHMLSLNDSPEFVVDSIIYGIFHLTNSARKRMFWGAFGDIVLNNLIENLDLQLSDSMLCSKCMSRFSVDAYKLRCPVCGFQHTGTRTAVCVDCGEDFIVDARNNSKIRCEQCQNIHRRRYKTNKERDYRMFVDR